MTEPYFEKPAGATHYLDGWYYRYPSSKGFGIDRWRGSWDHHDESVVVKYITNHMESVK